MAGLDLPVEESTIDYNRPTIDSNRPTLEFEKFQKSVSEFSISRILTPAQSPRRDEAGQSFPAGT